MQLVLENLDPADLTGRRLIRLTLDNSTRLRLCAVVRAEEATHQIVPVLGSPFITHLPERDPVVSGEISRLGYWEFAESVLLLSALRPGMNIVDAGANLGYYTTLLGRHLGTAGSVLAF